MLRRMLHPTPCCCCLSCCSLSKHTRSHPARPGVMKDTSRACSPGSRAAVYASASAWALAVATAAAEGSFLCRRLRARSCSASCPSLSTPLLSCCALLRALLQQPQGQLQHCCPHPLLPQLPASQQLLSTSQGSVAGSCSSSDSCCSAGGSSTTGAPAPPLPFAAAANLGTYTPAALGPCPVAPSAAAAPGAGSKAGALRVLPPRYKYSS